MSITVILVSTETTPTSPEPVVTRLAVGLHDEGSVSPQAWAVRVCPNQSDHLLRGCYSALHVLTEAAVLVCHAPGQTFDPLQGQLSRLGLEPLRPASIRDTQALAEYVDPTLGRSTIRGAMRATQTRELTSADRYHALGPCGDPDRLDEVVRLCRLYLQLARLGRRIGFEPDLTPTASVRWGMAFDLIPAADSLPAGDREAA